MGYFKTAESLAGWWSGRWDSNSRPSAPKAYSQSVIVAPNPLSVKASGLIDHCRPYAIRKEKTLNNQVAKFYASCVSVKSICHRHIDANRVTCHRCIDKNVSRHPNLLGVAAGRRGQQSSVESGVACATGAVMVRKQSKPAQIINQPERANEVETKTNTLQQKREKAIAYLGNKHVLKGGAVSWRNGPTVLPAWIESRHAVQRAAGC